PVGQCETPKCDLTSGLCVGAPKSDGTPCSDGNACTTIDTCTAGVCGGAGPVVCSASDQCHAVGTCNPATGACSNPAKGDGAACTDGDACTTSDTCQSGACVGASPAVCTASDQCHVAGTCSASTGACSNPAKGDGARCADGNACTLGDTWQTGRCGGASPVACTASDQCHVAGTCNTSTGACSNPAKGDGATCDDSNVCTTVDTCVGGT